jgi:hypothetical protein
MRLLADEPLRRRLAENAAADARARFDLSRQCDDYVGWYRDILGRGKPSVRAGVL